MYNILDILEIGDELEIEIIGLDERFKAKIVIFDNCQGRHPWVKVLNNDVWGHMVLRDNDFKLKKILTLDRCVICKSETPYTKDGNIEERENYIQGSGQLCKECAKKQD